MSKKVLIVATNEKVFPNGKAKSGVWLGTVARFVDVLNKRGFDYQIISPEGGEVFIDPHSLGRFVRKKIDLVYNANEEFRESLKHTLSPLEINPLDYDAIYYSSGYATLTDFPNNALLQDITKIIYENGGVVASIGHGLSGLLNVKLSDGSLLLKDRMVTGFSNFEDIISGNKKYMPYWVENEARNRGAKYSKALLPFAVYTVSDAQVVTGQTTCAARTVAIEVTRVLRNITDTLGDAKKAVIHDNSMSLRPSC